MSEEKSVEINWKFLIGLISIVLIIILLIYFGMTTKETYCAKEEIKLVESNCLSSIIFHLPYGSEVSKKGYTPFIQEYELCNLSNYYYPVYIEYADVTEVMQENIYNFTTMKNTSVCTKNKTRRITKTGGIE